MSQSPPNIPAALKKILQELSKRPAQVLLYGSVIAAIATIGGVPLSPPMAALVTAVGGNLLSNIIEQVAKKGDLADDDYEQLQKTIASNEITISLNSDEFNREILQLNAQIDLQSAVILNALQKLAIGDKFDEIIARMNNLATKEQTNEILTIVKDTHAAIVNQRRQPPIDNCNFVPEPDHFVGRANELATLDKALGITKAIAIRGIGGIGKSTLAKAFAQRNEHFKLKLWAELGQSTDEVFLRHILRQWTEHGFPPEWSLDQMIATSCEILTEHARRCGEPVLLVIDDVWAETVPQARILRKATPLNTRVLITTRSEQVGLALGCTFLPLEEMPRVDGAKLIIELLNDQQLEDYKPSLEHMSEVLQGHPLALSLAARQIGLNRRNEWIEKLTNQFEEGIKIGDELSNLELDVGEEKVDSVRVTLKMTLDKLGGTNEETHNLRFAQFLALGVLPPDISFHINQLWIIWNANDSKALTEFLGEGLLVQTDYQDWYTQHRLLRAYARALLKNSENTGSIMMSHWNYLLVLAKDIFDLPPTRWFELERERAQIGAFAIELAQIRQSIDNTIRQSQPDSILYKKSSEITREIERELYKIIIPFYDYLAQSNHAGVLTAAGVGHRLIGNYDKAIEYFNRALEILYIQPDPEIEGRAHRNIAPLLWDQGKLQEALEHVQSARQLQLKIGGSTNFEDRAIRIWSKRILEQLDDQKNSQE